MRYFTEKPDRATTTRMYTYSCNHPLYSECSLIKLGDAGLAIVQRRFNKKQKVFWYGPVESWLIDEIQTHSKFQSYFESKCGKCKDGLYPTVTVRQIMWALKMKPLKKAWWESQDKQLL